MASESSFVCPVAACGQTFGSYRGLTGQWKYINEPTVNLYQCAGCLKTFLMKPSALRHTRARCRGGLQTMVAVNKTFCKPWTLLHADSPSCNQCGISQGAGCGGKAKDPWGGGAGATRPDGGQDRPINNRDETISMVRDRVFKTLKKNW